MTTTAVRSKKNERPAGIFSRLATSGASTVGSPWAFATALGSILLWAAVGPRFHFSDTWQLVMNSWTDIFTFLIVFLIQHTQNRDSKAINLKLDELVRALHGAENELIDVEKLSDQELQRLERRYERIRKTIHSRREQDQAH